MEKVGIREFRNNIAKYVDGNTPLTVMKHGHTVGYYIPVQQNPEAEDYRALQQAAQIFDKMMHECGLDEEVLLQEFQAVRRQQKTEG
jgi:antitoxin (DNA-binding transcriptional repressor) of toxin-antitoxin stability system